MTTNYNSYSNDLTILETGGDKPWSNIVDSLGYNPSNSVWGSIISSEAGFATESVAYRFNFLEISEFIQESPVVAVFKVKVKYSLSCKPETNPSISLQSYLAVDGEDLGLNSQTVDGVATGEDNEVIKVAVVSFYTENIPTEEQLKNEKFQFVMSFDAENKEEEEIGIKVYQIEIEIVNGTGVGYLLIRTDDGLFLEYGNSIFLQNTEVGNQALSKFSIYNAGEQRVIIESNGIQSKEGLITFESNPWPSNSIEIDSQSYYENNFAYGTATPGLNLDSITILSDALIEEFEFYLSFTATSSLPNDVSIISPVYNNASISNNASLSISSFPINVTSIITIKINNTGTSNLIISSLTVSGSGGLSSGSIGAGSSISPSSYGNININLSTNTQGNKSVSVQIVSNSSTNSVYNFTFTYAVLQQSKIEFSEGFSSGSANSVLVNGQETDFGTVERDRSLLRYFVLKNSGIYKSLIINSITSSSSDMSVLGLPSLPYILIPNNGNAVTFSVGFETSEVGLKEGVLSIDYEEGSVYVPPTTP